MMNRCLLPLCACLLGILAFAQENPVLMRVNGREVSRSEFEYSYHHYRAGGGRDLSPKEYALLFSQAIQKVEAAKAIRLDTTAAFRKQQEENRIKLMEDCLVDKQTVDSCVRVSYQKMALKARTGQVQVMQIFKYLPQTITSRHLEEEKARMDSIYQAIRNQPGLDFSALVKCYSDDRQNRWIGGLQTTVEFENIAFALSKGEISEPFFTPAGIHILKVMDRKELPVYEDVVDGIVQRILHKEIRNQGIGKVIERLKREWRYTPNQTGIEELLTKGDTERTLFAIDGQEYTGGRFKQFAASHPMTVKRQLEEFVAKSLLDYESKKLG